MQVDVSRETFRAALDAGLDELSLPLPEQVREKSGDLYSLLFDWNRVHNLTRVVEPAEAARRHFVESWSLLTVPGLFEGVRSCADIGSGAGFPGLPLALALPGIHWTLIEKAQKKAAYLTFAAAALKVNNVSVLCADARKTAERFDLITFRALTSDDRFILDLAALLSPAGRFVLFLGPAQQAPDGFAGEELSVALGDRTLRLVVGRPRQRFG